MPAVLSCAARQATLDGNEKISEAQRKIIVFAFRNASYKGRELKGVGTGFTIIFVNEILATGRDCRLVESEEFVETKVANSIQACKYAKEQGADVAIIGMITEWLDGATQWSGRVDVVSAQVYAYDPETCSLITSASGRERGTWFTCVNAPATRFYPTLSKDLVAVMFE